MHRHDHFFNYEIGPGGPGGPFGPKFLFRGGPGMGHRRRMRRGDVRGAILLLLEEEPRNGYQVMQELEQRSEGAWRPSPGSGDPSLQLLADEGLVTGATREGGTVYSLTDAGRKQLDEERERIGTPWEQAGAGISDDMRNLGRSIRDVAMAASQVMQTHNPEHQKAAAEVLADARKKLYGILAGD